MDHLHQNQQGANKIDDLCVLPRLPLRWLGADVLAFVFRIGTYGDTGTPQTLLPLLQQMPSDLVFAPHNGNRDNNNNH